MTPSSFVTTVYAFLSYEGWCERPELSGFKATDAAIRELGGELLPATAETVPSEWLDAEGCYRRRAVGWCTAD